MAAYFNRPELEIVEESCAAEITLNAKLREAPFSVIDDAEIDAIADNDVADNYRAVLQFRDFLVSIRRLRQPILLLRAATRYSRRCSWNIWCISFCAISSMVKLIR